MDPGWHTYWQYPGESGTPTKVEWVLPEGYTAGPLQWPLPKLEDDGTFQTFVYDDEAVFLAEITPPPQLPAGDVTLTAKLSWQVCEKICIQGGAQVDLTLPTSGAPAPANAALFAKARVALPKAAPPFPVHWDASDPKQLRLAISGLDQVQKLEFFPLPPRGVTPGHATVSAPDAQQVRTITLPLDNPAPAGTAWRGLLVAQRGGTREGWYVSSSQVDTGATSPSTSSRPSPLVPTQGLLSVLGLAFLGGLVLNVMPCVLPVIALKIFGFVKQAADDPRRVFRLGLAFVAGVFAFFFSLATVAVALHASGQNLTWGAQFQNPILFSAIIALVFVFGLNLLGVFEITLSGQATTTLSDLSSREGVGGAFVHGLFTTLLGTSCTAPFLAVSLGYALTRPAPIIYLLFLTVALGMSLPYFLLTANPGWMRFLPKPGLWMERFKQLMGFVMLAVVVWLFSVMVSSRPERAVNLGWYLLALALACWLFGSFSQPAVRWLLVPLLVIGGFFEMTRLAAPDGLPWQRYSDEKLARSVEHGEPVFVDFTADWCLNCKTYEKAVLRTEPIRQAFAQKKVVMLRADWTEPNEEIRRALERFGRVGIPLYVLYRPGEKQPVLLDALTSNILLHHLSLIRGAAVP